MQPKHRASLITAITTLIAISGFVAAFVFAAGSQAEKPIFLGLSVTRLFVLVITLIATSVTGVIAYLSTIKGGIAMHLEKRLFGQSFRPISYVCLVLFLASAILALLSDYYLGNSFAYVDNLRPILIWVIFSFFSTYLGLQIGHYGIHVDRWKEYWPNHRVTLLGFLGSAIFFFLIWVSGKLTGNLRITKEDFWYGTGVPLLAWQVFLSVVISVMVIKAFKFSSDKSSKNHRKDILLFFMIWAVTAAFWAPWPIKANFNIATPRPPNSEYYPDVDAIVYDSGAQLALIGEGLNGGAPIDRPLYMFFLFLLHLIVGQNYEIVAGLQAGIFAIFPALIYLIGKNIHRRESGLVAAAFLGFRGINSLIASPWIDNSHIKNLMTDFPTALSLAILALLIILALKHRNWHYLLWASGVLGLSSYIRSHNLVLFPVVGLAGLLLLWKHTWKRWLLNGMLVVASFFIAIFPWAQSNHVSIFELYNSHLDLMLEQRYIPETYLPTNLQRAYKASILHKPKSLIQEDVPDLPFQVVHFLHNFVTAPTSLPNTLTIHSIRYTVKDGEPFWNPLWDGQMSTSAGWMLTIGLGLIALGIGAAIQSGSKAGIIPFLVTLLYFAANAFARTSGGRYLVPVDWVIYLYLALGCVEIWILMQVLFGKQVLDSKPEIINEPPLTIAGALKALVGLLFIGMMIPVLPSLIKPIYPDQTKGQTLGQLLETSQWKLTSLSKEELVAFSQLPKSIITQGQALYPRFFSQGDGLPVARSGLRTREFPRLVFKMIGPKVNQFVVLPGKNFLPFPNTERVIVIGCVEPLDIQTLAVILPDQNLAYMRSPSSPLTCPLKTPVCDNNKNCR